jgi:subtilisin family serine protease
MPVRVLDPQGRASSFTIAMALVQAIKEGADVVNLSLGTSFQPLVLQSAVEWAMEQGVVVVAAAGNRNETVPQYPAAFDPVLAVTAVDGENRKADFANYSAEWVNIAAPGAGITSTVVGPLGNGYAIWSGTSMAVPFVSGAVALIRQQHTDLPVQEIFAYLTSNATDLDPFNPQYEGMLGQGLLNVQDSVQISADPSPTPMPTVTPIPKSTPWLYIPQVIKE